MKLVKSIWTLRSKSHLSTRLQLRDEANFAYDVLPIIGPFYIAFSFVDWFSTPKGTSLATFIFIRALAVGVSRIFYLLARGRTRYATRLFFLCAPYVFAIEYIMVSENLMMSPYFAGLALVMLSCTMYFPVRVKIIATIYTICIIPLLAWVVFEDASDFSSKMNLILMTLGSAILSAANSGKMYQDFKGRLIAAETLTRVLGKREKEIRDKANQLLRRKAFESQFSPQVVTAVLQDGSALRDMSAREIAVIVIDIESSTFKAKTLEPANYKHVIEEVFDVFSSACLRWNVTVDKFTGDGAQAFAGAPVKGQDDLLRAIMACKETMRMLRGREIELTQRWGSQLNIRFAISEGQALVGFLGRGTLKSFTAIGDVVSFTHRLCGVSDPWAIAVYSNKKSDLGKSLDAEFAIEARKVSGLKGFGTNLFEFNLLKPFIQTSDFVVDHGRCNDCGTPLLLEDTSTGLPRIVCPGCQSRQSKVAA